MIDAAVRLTATAPQGMLMMEVAGMQQLHVTPDITAADMIVSVLKSQGVTGVILDKNIASMHPAVSFWTGVRIMVDDEDYVKARRILNEYLRRTNTEDQSS